MSSRLETYPGQLSGKSRLAGIDVGSHTTRLLIALRQGDEILPLRTERRITRLAHGFQDAQVITEEAQERNLAAMREYASMLHELQVRHIACGATGVIRRARNSDAVLNRIAAETGIEGSILSEEMEAFLSTMGMMSVLPESGESNLLTFDIGGGSTEFLLVMSGSSTPVWSSSRPIGAATVTESFLCGDPPGDKHVERAVFSSRKEILWSKRQMLAALSAEGIDPDSLMRLQLAGTAGTVTTLAAMFLEMDRYVPYRVNGIELSQEWLSRTVRSLATMPLAKRRLIRGLEPGREQIILGGAIIASEILACFNQERFVATDSGLLEGLLLKIAEEESGRRDADSRSLRSDLTWRIQKG